MERIIICDIDGTLTLFSDRLMLIAGKDVTRKNYDEFNRRSSEDRCKEDIANIIRNLKDVETKIYLITAREEKWRSITEDWLALNEVPYDKLHMRPNNSKEKDSEVKLNIVTEKIDKTKIWFVLEDRTEVVSMYRKLGLTCLQVEKGEY